MKTLYITDLDGTFLDSEGKISSKTRKLISEAIEKGALFTLATARTFATVMQMFDGINLKLPVSLMNGVMLYEPQSRKILSFHSIDRKITESIFNTYKTHGIYPLVYRCIDDKLEIEYFNTDNPYQMKYIGNRTEADGKKFIFSPSFDFEEKEDIIYIVTLDKYEKILPLYEDIKKIENVSCVFYRDNYTDCYFLEIFAKGVSKATAMLEIKELISAERIVAFGDNLNDMQMFIAADESYAVANACDELKAVATDVIGNNDSDSVAEYILNNVFGEEKP